MSQPEAITYLQTPRHHPIPRSAPSNAFNLGEQLFATFKNENTQPQGLIGDYRFNTQQAEIIPVKAAEASPASCYIWDTDADLKKLPLELSKTRDGQRYTSSTIQLQNNRLILNQDSLSGPDITLSKNGSVLTLSPQFELRYHTDAFSAKLGIIHLVQAQRFVVLENGEQLFLFDSGDNQSVLYLENENQSSPFCWQSATQEENSTQTHITSVEVSQLIPEQINGQRVVNLTVLEKYTSFVMQQSCSETNLNAVWIPALSPITWGWSVRAGCRSDGDWAIMRRKVMLPTLSDEGLRFPLWHHHNFASELRPEEI